MEKIKEIKRDDIHSLSIQSTIHLVRSTIPFIDSFHLVRSTIHLSIRFDPDSPSRTDFATSLRCPLGNLRAGLSSLAPKFQVARRAARRPFSPQGGQSTNEADATKASPPRQGGTPPEREVRGQDNVDDNVKHQLMF